MVDSISMQKQHCQILIKQCPDIVDHLISLNPKFEKLKTPMVKVMAKVATIKMMAELRRF